MARSGGGGAVGFGRSPSCSLALLSPRPPLPSLPSLLLGFPCWSLRVLPFPFVRVVATPPRGRGRQQEECVRLRFRFLSSSWPPHPGAEVVMHPGRTNKESEAEISHPGKKLVPLPPPPPIGCLFSGREAQHYWCHNTGAPHFLQLPARNHTLFALHPLVHPTGTRTTTT